jgi:uncharacterized protein with ParB-like and HNH nuclease domain
MSGKSSRRKTLNHTLASVYDLFNSNQHYVVPRYQRGYHWTSEQVGNLLTDLDEAFGESPGEEYLLGQIIVCPSEEPDKHLDSTYIQWDVIDGQQRCTTLYLMLVAMYLKLKLLYKESNASQFRQVSEMNVLSTHNTGSEIEWPKIKPASNGMQILEALVNGMKIPEVDGPTSENLLSAWSQINEFIDRIHEKNYFEDFLKYFQKQVVVIRLELDEAVHALRVFSKVNDRGLTLDDSDLIKNFLFQKVSKSEEFEKLAGYWDESLKILYGSRFRKTKTMDFLLKLKVGINTGKSVSSGKLFTVWSKEILKTEDDVKDFARKLPTDAQTVKNLSYNTVTQNGGYSDWNFFTGIKRVLQHFEVLLAADHLTPPVYNRLNRLVQERTLLAVLSKTEKEFETLVHPWAKLVSKLDTHPSKEEIWATAKEAGVLEGLDDLFDTAFIKVQALRYSTQSHQETLRYLLARASKIVQDSVDSNILQLNGYMETTSSKKNAKLGFDLDHIFPKSHTQFQLHWIKSEDWESLDDDQKAYRENKVIHSIGNLALLHPQDNREQSDSLPWEEVKIENFGQSQLYLNRLLVQDSQKQLRVGQIQKIEELRIPALPQLEEWSEEAVEERAKAIWTVVKAEMKQSLQGDF